MKEKEPIMVAENVSALGLLVFCYTCGGVLYETSDKNTITERIADSVMEDHWDAFTEDHSVVKIDFKPIKYN